jgi:beta-lactamase class D
MFAMLFLYALQVQAVDWHEAANVSRVFQRANVTGTMVVYDVNRQQMSGHNYARAGTRFIPASTFKIANSLIGLSVGAVSSVDEVLPYGGHPQLFKAWEKDMSLRDAIAISNVPIYQELARRTGLQAMQLQVARLHYGNADIGQAVDQFWLTGPLLISAIEQAEFLARLAREELPMDKKIQRDVREIIYVEQGEGWSLYAKTGWVNAPGPGVGWWVGWLHNQDGVYSFALNMDIEQRSDANKRVTLGKACLQALGLVDSY